MMKQIILCFPREKHSEDAWYEDQNGEYCEIPGSWIPGKKEDRTYQRLQKTWQDEAEYQAIKNAEAEKKKSVGGSLDFVNHRYEMDSYSRPASASSVKSTTNLDINIDSQPSWYRDGDYLTCEGIKHVPTVSQNGRRKCFIRLGIIFIVLALAAVVIGIVMSLNNGESKYFKDNHLLLSAIVNSTKK